MTTEKKQPLGDQIRELIQPALDDERCAPIQLGILSDYFTQVAAQFPQEMAKQYREIYNQAAGRTPSGRTPVIVKMLTRLDSGSGGMQALEKPYSPKFVSDIPICIDFTHFSAEDIKALPSYIALHELARAENVAIKIEALTAEEARAGYLPRLIIDGSKTYEQGSMENGNLYPANLPSLSEEEEQPKSSTGFDRTRARKITF